MNKIPRPPLRTKAASSKLRQLATPRFQLLADAIQALRWKDALEELAEARFEYQWAHDGFRNAVARSLDAIFRAFGQPAVEALGLAAMEDNFLQMHQMYDQMDIRGQVKTAAAGWHWHMTKFRLTEDDEKVTFLLEPCGSGGRLINEGAYYGTLKKPLALIPNGSAATFGETDFPIYCNHCSELTAIGLKMGAYGFLMEGWTKAHRHGACRQHAFKRLANVPAEFFQRTNVDRAKVAETHQGKVAARVFSEQELKDIATPPMDRLEQAIRKKDCSAAVKITDECKLGWGAVIHDVYRDWLSAIYIQTLKLHGAEALRNVMRQSGRELFEPLLVAVGKSTGIARRDAWAVYWRSHNAIHSLTTTSSGWQFKLAPGRIVSEPMSRQWPGRWMQGFCDAVNEGITTEGDQHRFGTLTVAGDYLIHDLPSGEKE